MRRQQLHGNDLLDWLRLARTPAVGPVTFAELMRRSAWNPADACTALTQLARSSGRRITLSERSVAASEIAHGEALGARLLPACDPDYPAALAALDPPPPALWAKGDLSLLARPAIAVVGARNASVAGRKMARELARDLGAAGYVVASGLARGIDGEAHAAALATGTIAVLAGGIDVIYPPEHADLHADIARRGLLVAEHPPGLSPRGRDFPRRNRIISGLSLACVVVEAAARSGSLHTARAALEQGREVMAVPGSPLDPRTRGSNGLLREGAVLVETVDDITRALAGLAPRRTDHLPAEPQPAEITPGLPGQDIVAAVRACLTHAPAPAAEIAASIGAPYRLVLSAIAELELSGAALTFPGALASLNPDPH